MAIRRGIVVVLLLLSTLMGCEKKKDSIPTTTESTELKIVASWSFAWHLKDAVEVNLDSLTINVFRFREEWSGYRASITSEEAQKLRDMVSMPVLRNFAPEIDWITQPYPADGGEALHLVWDDMELAFDLFPQDWAPIMPPGATQCYQSLRQISRYLSQVSRDKNFEPIDKAELEEVRQEIERRRNHVWQISLPRD